MTEAQKRQRLIEYCNQLDTFESSWIQGWLAKRYLSFEQVVKMLPLVGIEEGLRIIETEKDLKGKIRFTRKKE